MNLLPCQRRPQRPGESTGRCAVTFIVTLAATGSVTLAARSAGMSRKAAYPSNRAIPPSLARGKPRLPQAGLRGGRVTKWRKCTTTPFFAAWVTAAGAILTRSFAIAFSSR